MSLPLEVAVSILLEPRPEAVEFAEIGAEDSNFLWFNALSRPGIVLVLVAVPVITAALTLLPAPRRWCRGTPTGAVTAETVAAQADPAQIVETDYLDR